MPRLVISTVGTSLLTNQIDTDIDPGRWLKRLQESANYTTEEVEKYHEDVKDIIEQLQERLEIKFENDDIDEIKLLSAELNGIYSLYKNQIEEAKLDAHYLVTTDTKQGLVAAQIIQNFLRSKKVNSVDIYTPEKLSAANTKNFAIGIDNLIDWVKRVTEQYHSQGYEIYFNLVGGFKAFQGCMNTIGMFYADKMIYIFEGKNSDLIIIPKLPIDINHSQLKDHVALLTMLDMGAGLHPSKTSKVPESMISEIDGKVTLSNWGKLIWDQCKDNFLSESLIEDFPCLYYEDSFRRDYKKINKPEDKAKLQETLAKVSFYLEDSNGNTKALSKPVSYYAYQGTKDKQGVDHFYVGIHYRISCKMIDGKLHLRHYGTHNYVEGKERN